MTVYIYILYVKGKSSILIAVNVYKTPHGGL